MSSTKTILDHGLTLLTMPVPFVKSVCVAIFLATGSRYEDDQNAGMSHFVEHMLFKGSARRPSARLISEEIEGIGGLINAGTSRETTMYWIKVAQPHVRLGLDVLADMLMHPILDTDEIEKERHVIIEEINMVQDSPESLVQVIADSLLWSHQPLGREISGTKESVSAVTREALLAHMGQYYGPSRTVISVAGAIDPNEILDIVTEQFGDWRPAPGGTPPAYRDDQAQPRVQVAYKDTEQAHLCLSLPSIARDHPDRFVLTMANTILGDGMSSRLFQEIRERRALAYNVESFIGFLQDTGVTSVYAGVDPGRALDTLDAILQEMCRLRDELALVQELKRSLEFNRGRLMLQMENTSAVASWYGRQEILPGTVFTVDQVIEKLEMVTREDVQRSMRHVLNPQKMNLAVVGPFETPDAFLEHLRLPGNGANPLACPADECP